MDYDASNLTKLGRRRERAVSLLAEIDTELLPEVMEAKAAGLADERIANLARVTRGTVRSWIKKERDRIAATS